MSSLAVSYVWQFIFSYTGPLNTLLDTIGLESLKRPWTGDPTWALWTIFVVLVWQFVGLSMVMYLAGLEGIPEELDEASAVDGASTFRRFRKITLPLLAPAITVSVTLSTIYGLGVFDQVLAVTGGGPVDASETLATQIYKQTFAFGRFGYGTALSLVLTVLITVLAVASSSFSERARGGCSAAIHRLDARARGAPDPPRDRVDDPVLLPRDRGGEARRRRRCSRRSAFPTASTCPTSAPRGTTPPSTARS